MKRINFAIAGLGVINPKEPYAEGHIERPTMAGMLRQIAVNPETLEQEGAVGDLNCNFFRENGESMQRFGPAICRNVQ